MKWIFAVLIVWSITGTLRAQESALDVRLRFLTAGYSYELPFSNPLGVFYDRKNKEIYICDAGNHQVVICDSSGFPIYRFKHWVESGGRRFLGEPRSIAVNSQGDIYLVDNLSDYIDVLDHRGERQYQIHLASLLGLLVAKPTCLTMDSEDVLYIAFRNTKSELVALDSDLKILLRLENREENHQNFGEISGLWVDSNIHLTDAVAEPCLRVFSKEGEYLLGFGTHEVGWDGFSLPSGVVTTSGGVIWIADTFRQVVKAFSPKGVFMQYIGGFGRAAGAMDYPAALAGDGDTRMYVVEKAGERIQGFEVAPEE
jgi:hypothetical protein